MANVAREKSRAEKEIWLVYATKQSGKGRVAYSDAVEEALCFGWIDGIMKSIDTNYFAQRFSPRRSAKSGVGADSHYGFSSSAS